MAKHPIIGSLKRLDKSFLAFQKQFVKTFEDSADIRKATDIPNLPKLNDLTVDLHAKLAVMPKAFRLRVEQAGLYKLICTIEDYTEKNLILRLHKSDGEIDGVHFKTIFTAVSNEIRIIDAVVNSREIERYMEQFDHITYKHNC